MLPVSRGPCGRVVDRYHLGQAAAAPSGRVYAWRSTSGPRRCVPADRGRYNSRARDAAPGASGYLDIPPSSLQFHREQLPAVREAERPPCPRAALKTATYRSRTQRRSGAESPLGQEQVAWTGAADDWMRLHDWSADMNGPTRSLAGRLSEPGATELSSAGESGPRRCSSAPGRASATRSASSRPGPARGPVRALAGKGGPDQVVPHGGAQVLADLAPGARRLTAGHSRWPGISRPSGSAVSRRRDAAGRAAAGRPVR